MGSREGFPAVRREWEPEELIASWTLTDRDWELISNKSGANRLGFALLVRFFDLEARFPAHPGDLPQAAVEYVAGLVKVPPGALADYEWSGRTIEYHRAQIRRAFGFREPTRADELRLTEWLAGEVCSVEVREERQRDALLSRCREERLEKEIDYLTGFTSEFTTVATRENIPREQLRKRLLLALFALGTNMGDLQARRRRRARRDRGHAQAHPPDPHQP